MTNFGHQISLKNTTLCHKDIYPLLLECFLTSLRWMRMVGRASDRINDPLMINTVSCPPKYPQISSTITNFGHQISLRNTTLCHKDIHPLLLECFLTFLRWMRVVGRASGDIPDLLIVITVSFLPNQLSIYKHNDQC